MKRVLIIDDDKSVCVAIEVSLRRQGFNVVSMESVALDTTSLENAEFDVAMVDILMPGIDGLEVIKRLRASVPALPIVAMSGYRFQDGASRSQDYLDIAVKLGASCSLRKPFGSGQLMAALNACLNEQSPPERPAGC